jgi:hypothetical protein
MMQAMGVPPTGQVAIAVAQRGVLQNPGGATGNLGGAAAAAARRSLGRNGFRREVARQIQGGQAQAGQLQGGQTQVGQGQTGQLQGVQGQAGQTQGGQVQAGTPTINNNPVASKLLLAPTFTPIQANAVIDQTNMRIAIPVRQVDGEFILTMQKMEGVQAVQPAPAQDQQPTPAEGQTPAPETSARPAENNTTLAEAGKGLNSTELATPEAGKKPERRQESGKDKYGNDKPPQGAVIMTMKMIDDMVNAVQWGGQAAITKMMSEYVKGQTGKDLTSIDNKEPEAAAAKIVV